MDASAARAPARWPPADRPRAQQALATTAGVTALVVATTWLVYAAGGARWAGLHLAYVPILLAALRLGALGAVPTALLAGLALGPAMPLDTLTGEPQEPVNWLTRVALFVVVGLVTGASRDIAQRRHAALAGSESRFRSLVRNASDLILVYEYDGTIRYASPSVERVLGYPPARLVDSALAALVHPADARAMGAAVGPLSGDRAAGARFRHSDGSWRHLRLITTDLRGDPGVGGFVLNGRDVTEQQAIEAELLHQALHDPVTGLANRSLFCMRLERALEEPRGADGLAVFVVAPDRFEGVTDAYGHAAGDQILATLAQRLLDLVPREELVARYDGSELIVLRRHVTDEAHAREVAEHLRGAAAESFALGGEDVHLTVSVGGVRHDRHAGTEALIGDAYVALREARRAGGDRSVVFHPSLRRHHSQWLRTDTALQRALRSGQLQAYYQPIVDLADGRAVGFEALLRWHHPTLGVVLPGEFVPIAEQTGSIVRIGAWMLGEACVQLARWRDQHPECPELSVSVNLSARQLDDPGLPSIVERALEDSGIPASRLTIEITETSLVADTASTNGTLRNLKSLGVRIAVDDFGTGYSSLGYLRRLPIDALKIDRTFVRELGSGPRTDVIVSAVVGLARSLSVRTVAEGVETRAQASELLDLGCDLQQGFLFSRPAPAQDIDLTALVGGTGLAHRA